MEFSFIKFLYPLIFPIIISSCSEGRTKDLTQHHYPIKEYDNKLVEEKSLIIPLSYDFSWDFVIIPNNESDSLIHFFDKNSYSLFTFDLFNKKSNKTIRFEVNGPLGIGDLGTSPGMVISDSSIYILNYNEGTLISTDMKINKISKIELEDDYVVPYSEGPSQLNVQNNYLFIPLYPYQRLSNDLRRTPSYYILDRSNNAKTKGIFQYTDKYEEGYYGMFGYQYYTNYCYNPLLNQYIVNYPIENKLYIYNENFKLIKTENAPSDVFKHVPPLVEDAKYRFIPKDNRPERESIYFKTTSTHYAIFFDNEKNIYYRIHKIFPTLENLVDGANQCRISVSAFDENFVKLNETILDGKYNLKEIFFYNGQLALIDRSHPNEDEMKIDFFILQ